MGSRTSLTVYPGMHGMMENAFIHVKNRSHDITAELEVPIGGASGVVFARGERFGGWSLHVQNGYPVYTYTCLGLERYVVRSSVKLPAGRVTLRYVFVYDGPQPGQCGTEMIYINGTKVASGKIDKTQRSTFSLDDAADVGMDEGTPVSPEYPAWNDGFTGTIRSITIKVSARELTAEQKKQLEQLEADDEVSIE